MPRGQTQRGPVCFRPGCSRRVRQYRERENKACSWLCAAAAHATETAARIAEATGSDEHNELAQALNDAISALHAADHAAYKAARSVGISSESWNAIAQGR